MFNKELLDDLGKMLIKKKLSVAVAESVTAGLLQAAFSNAKDASSFFQGGITAYNVGQKCRHLLVEPLHAIECDSVSERVACDMSKQACSMFTSDYGIGITGYASKMPEKKVDTLFTYYAIAEKGKIIHSDKLNTDVEEGLPAQLFYVEQVLEKFKQLLQ